MAKSFRDLDFQPIYTTKKNDVVNEFYIPALSVATSYDRITGFFSSSALSIAARGLSKFLLNPKSKMRMIVSCKGFSSSDEIEKIYSIEDEVIHEFNEILKNDIDKLEDEIIKKRVAALGWLLKENRLEIRVARLSQLDYEQGMLHSKFGILHDNQEETICFSGSINESQTGWKINGEHISVFKSFQQGQDEYVRLYANEFDDYWNNRVTNVQIIDLPDAIKTKIINHSPGQINELASEIDPEANVHEGKKLHYYQIDAVNSWEKNGMKGYFEMATGTGKTVAAIYSIKSAIKKKQDIGIIIAVPTKTLVDQWKDELISEGFKEKQISCCSSDYNGWQQTFQRYLLIDSNSNHFFIFTYNSLSKAEFQELISNSERPFILVCDEMHHAGAPEYSNCLNNKIEYRLGLSATPIRAHDIEGSQTLLNYFGEKPLIYFDISRALTEINPLTGKAYLCPYYYFFDSVNLTDSEYVQFKKLSKDIAFMFNKKKSGTTEEKYQPDKLRALLISCASEKLDNLEKMLKNIKNGNQHKKLLVYCQSYESKDVGEKQIQSVKRILAKNNLNCLEYTSRFDDRVLRKKILSDFESGTIDAIVAIKCLDEGVDIPSIRTAIILASSSNSAEYIQRRGRILRNSQGKNHANIFDIVVGPPKNEEVNTSDKTLIYREATRAIEYANHALNKDEQLSNIDKWLKEYGLTRSEINA